jgi:hypothetical protein
MAVRGEREPGFDRCLYEVSDADVLGRNEDFVDAKP